jgi:hypothetical protein
MKRRAVRPARLPALAVAAVLFPGVTSAQTIDRLPVTISAGGGVLMPYSYPERPTTDLFVSAQIPLQKSIVVEGQVLRSASDHARSGYFDNRSDRPFMPFSTWTADHEALNVGANLLMRMGGPRLKLFFGGGLGHHRAETRMQFETRCEPRTAGGCDGQPDTTKVREFYWSGPSWQLVGGVEAPIAPRLTAFGGVRWLTTSLEAGDTGLGALAGIRASLRQASAEPPRPGPIVRVNLASGGQRKGELLSLTASEVVIRDEHQQHAFSLDQVSRVERATHYVRNGVLWGLAVGFAGGYLGSCGQGDEEDCWPEVGALFAGIGAGTGALIGAGVNRATADSRVLYSRPTSTVSVAPRLSPAQVGMEVTIRF